MRTTILASVTAALAALAPFAAVGAVEDAKDTEPAPPAPEKEIVEGIKAPVPVWSKRELTIGTPKIADLAKTELWYRSFDGKAWGDWAKHGIVFDVGSPIVWTPPEGVWQVYLRPFLTSGLSEAEPKGEPNPKLSTIFIIDRTAPTCAITFPQPKAKLRGGDKYTVKWEAADPHLRSAPVTLLWSRDGNTWEVIADRIPNKGAYDWTVPVDMTVSGQLKIQVMDKADNVGSAVNSAILVDSIKPHGQVVGPAITADAATTLDLQIADGGPAGLQSAQLWVSQDDGTSWTEGPWIKDPKHVAWKAPGDGRYRLAVVAIDQAGWSSPVPKGKSPDQFVLVVDSTPPLVQLTSAIGIVDADKAQANNRRDFKPGDRVQVPFLVKDVNLAPNTVAIYLQPGADKPWEELTRGQPLDAAYRFAIGDRAMKGARLKVTATDAAGNVGEAVASETFNVQTNIDIAGPGLEIDPGK